MPKAIEGKVETLFIARNKHSWGYYDEKTAKIEQIDEKEPKSLDLLSLAATCTHLHGGKVYFLPPDEMPQPSAKASAIYSLS